MEYWFSNLNIIKNQLSLGLVYIIRNQFALNQELNELPLNLANLCTLVFKYKLMEMLQLHLNWFNVVIEGFINWLKDKLNLLSEICELHYLASQ